MSRESSSRNLSAVNGCTRIHLVENVVGGRETRSNRIDAIRA